MPDSTSLQPLRFYADQRGIRIAAATPAHAYSDATYQQVLAREFNGLVPENELKFSEVHPASNTFTFAKADRMQQFAQGKRMGFRGHTLVWHSQVAPWVTAGNYRPTQLAEIIKRHISTVARRYSGKIYAWDVVNEAFNDNGTLRPSVWYNQPGIGFAIQGTKYIEQAFVWTRNADPTARLYYNDYSIETIGPKSNAVYNMVRDFRQRNVPIHGVGFQAHLDLNFNNASTLNSFRQNLRRFKALGVELQITELDIRLPSNSAEHLQQQANLADKLVDICLSEGVSLIQFWGFTDRYSWVPGFFTGYGWALPFDENYLPKPFYEAVRNRLILGPSPT